jgi:serine/threonine protein kinase
MATLAGQTLLGRYFLRELVGSGGMADVYLAWDQLRNAKMAVKVLRRDLGTNSRFFDRFANEADILRKLEHPNIVRLFEYEQDDGIAFIVMQWVEGSNLRQVLTNSHQPLSLADSSRVLESVCSALHYAHENKIYHCDIKPANIMLDIKGNTFDTLLADFGVAQLADTSGGGGTPTYMAPEQFTGDPIDARTDVYALGVTLFEVLTGGTTPYRGLAPSSEGSTTKERIAWEHLNCQPPSLLAINPNYSPAMEKVILTAMQKQPDKRFPSALSFYDAYEKARSTLPKGTISAVLTINLYFPAFQLRNNYCERSTGQAFRKCPASHGPARNAGERAKAEHPAPNPAQGKAVVWTTSNWEGVVFVLPGWAMDRAKNSSTLGRDKHRQGVTSPDKTSRWNSIAQACLADPHKPGSLYP